MTSCRPWFRGTLLVGMFLYGLFAVSVILPLCRRILGRRAQTICERVVMNWNRAVCRILHLRLKVTGLPDSSAGLTVANHVSWLDIIALGSLQPFLFVAKEEVAHWPVMGILARGIGTLLSVGAMRNNPRPWVKPWPGYCAGVSVCWFSPKARRPAGIRYCGSTASSSILPNGRMSGCRRWP